MKLDFGKELPSAVDNLNFRNSDDDGEETFFIDNNSSIVSRKVAYKVYPQSLSWFFWGGIAPPLTQTYFSIDGWWISFTLLLGPLFFIPSVFFFMPLLDKYGLRLATLVGAELVMLGSLVRCIGFMSVGSAATASIQEAHSIWPWMVVSQALNALAGPAVMAAPPKISAIWFASQERSISTAIAVTANPLGAAVGYLLGITVKTPADIEFQAWLQMILCVAIGAMVLLFVLDHPPTPSSASSDRDTADLHIWKTVTQLMTSNGSFVYLALAASCAQGFYSSWSGLFGLILTPLGFTSSQAGWVGFAVSLAGVLGGILVGAIASIVGHRYKLFIISLFLLSALILALFSLVTEGVILPHNFWAAAILATLGAFLFNAVNPVFYELAVEIAYPAGEGVVGAIMTLLVNVFLIPLLALQSFLPAPVINWIMVATAGVIGVSMIFVKFVHRREMTDRVVNPNEIEIN